MLCNVMAGPRPGKEFGDFREEIAAEHYFFCSDTGTTYLPRHQSGIQPHPAHIMYMHACSYLYMAVQLATIIGVGSTLWYS